MKKFLRFIIKGFLWLFVFLILNFFYIHFSTQPYVYNNLQKVPKTKVGMVLGTSKYTTRNTHNLFYKYRLQAAEDLYKNGKIDYILISGDNSSKYYNEPETMKKDLIKNGIPADKIVLDYAGFRTYDSVLRAKKVFGLDTLLVISQDFHIRRAIFIGRKNGMEIYGYKAKSPGGKSRFKILVREMLARVLAVWDVLIDKEPKYLGDKIKIG